MKFESTLSFRDRVWLDGEGSIEGIVTAFCFRETNCITIEVSWIHNGEAKSAWFEEWRLTKAE